MIGYFWRRFVYFVRRYADTFGGVRPKDPTYGALGDGVTIDTAAIQNAQDAAVAAGSHVWFDKGTYISGPIIVNQGEVIDWRGPGRDQVTIKLKDSPCGSLLERNSAGSVAINFEGLTFDGNKDGVGIDYTTRLVYFRDCAGATVKDCTFQNYAGHAFFPSVVTCTGDVTVLNTRWIDAEWHPGVVNQFAGSFGVITQGPGLSDSDKEIWIRVHGCTFEQTTACPDPGRGPQGVFIEWDKTFDGAGVMVSVDDNVFRRIGQNHVGNHAGPIKVYRGAKHIHITNNKFYDSSHRAIALHRCEFLRIDGNTIDGFTSPNQEDAGTGGITMVERELRGGYFLKSKHIISNNIIRGLDPATQLGGITWEDKSVGAELSEIHFHHNTIDGGRYGIAVDTVGGEITIDHNTIKNIDSYDDNPNKNNGILVRDMRDGAKIQIDHNVITWDPAARNPHSGILVTSGGGSNTGVHAFVNDNKIYNADGASIAVGDCEFASIENNKIFDQGATLAYSILVARNGTEIISNNYDNQGKTVLGSPVGTVMSEQFNNFGFDEQPGVVSWGSAAPEGVVDGYFGKVYIEVGSQRRVWQKDSDDGTLTGWVLVGSQTNG